MKRASTLAILLLTVVPVCAQPQKSTIKATKTGAEKVVKVIGADKAKTQSYCDMAKLGAQIDEADQKKNQKKVENLSQQMDAMSEKLGPRIHLADEPHAGNGPELKGRPRDHCDAGGSR